MEQPPSFITQGESDLVCRLHHSLYGMNSFLVLGLVDLTQ